MKQVCIAILFFATSPAFCESGAIPSLGGRFSDAVVGQGSINVPEKELGQALGWRDDTLTSAFALKTLARVKPEAEHSLRGAAAVKLYKDVSPSVVLIVTKDGLGSGSLISSDGNVITNLHVVEGYTEVGVIFKPVVEGVRLRESDLQKGRVVKLDRLRDLALLKVGVVPAGVIPLTIGDVTEVEVGSDVHAIGHPTGEAWTYTKGVVSQIRRNYEWVVSESAIRHRATVIQTQTPINPGNSGGPLLIDNEHIVGINSFKSQGEGLNFAVAADEISAFLNSPGESASPVNPATSSAGACKPRELYRGHSKDGAYDVVGLDVDCSGRAYVEFRLPDDKTLPLIAVMDRNFDGKADAYVYSFKRDWNWDISIIDPNFDGNWTVVGHHPDRGLIPSSYESYSSYLARGGRPLL